MPKAMVSSTPGNWNKVKAYWTCGCRSEAALSTGLANVGRLNELPSSIPRSLEKGELSWFCVFCATSRLAKRTTTTNAILWFISFSLPIQEQSGEKQQQCDKEGKIFFLFPLPIIFSDSRPVLLRRQKPKPFD